MNSQKTVSVWAKAFFSAQAGKTEEEKKRLVKRLFEILKKKRKEYLLPKILAKVERLLMKTDRITLLLARAHRPETISTIKKRLTRVFGQGKEVEVKVNPDLIAGFRAEGEGLLVKASVKDFLTQLREKIYG